MGRFKCLCGVLHMFMDMGVCISYLVCVCIIPVEYVSCVQFIVDVVQCGCAVGGWVYTGLEANPKPLQTVQAGRMGSNPNKK